MARVFTHHPLKLGIFGESGYGKSQYQLRFTLASRARVKFVFDHKGEFEHLAGAIPSRTPEELEAALASGWCVFNPHRMFPGKLPEAFNFFADFAWTIAEKIAGTKLFVADELALLTEGLKPQPLCRIFEDGRSVALDACCTGHGPNSLHNRIRGQFTEVVTFFLKSTPALEVMEREYAFDADIIRRLDRGEFLARSETGRFQAGRVF